MGFKNEKLGRNNKMFNLNFRKLPGMRKEDIAKILKTDKEALTAFEKSYAEQILIDQQSDNFFEINAKKATEMHEGVEIENHQGLDDIINRIVNELLQNVFVWNFDGKHSTIKNVIVEKSDIPVTNEEICKLSEHVRPQLTGNLMKVDISEPSYIELISNYQMYQNETNPKKRTLAYNLFRQGLDILDVDSITYKMIDTNPNSMSHWLPQLAIAIQHQDFFKIPKTTIVKVPVSMLQLTRIDYGVLTRTTLDIVNKFCQKVFNLDETKEYFIKTGTYSSKFDFRNAHVFGAKEVRELGEYLLFIHHQACQMASPLNNRSIYGVSTTTEWVVREFIKDKENNPCIYKGLPLHTEYRVFVDFDTKQVIGITPYWDSKVMKQRFGNEEDSDSPHMMHDYIIYSAHEEILMNRYNENVDSVKKHIESMLSDIENINGQWSIDIMQNDNDFWIIDMALAVNSALNECIPKGLLNPITENWIPELN